MIHSAVDVPCGLFAVDGPRVFSTALLQGFVDRRVHLGDAAVPEADGVAASNQASDLRDPPGQVDVLVVATALRPAGSPSEIAAAVVTARERLVPGNTLILVSSLAVYGWVGPDCLVDETIAPPSVPPALAELADFEREVLSIAGLRVIVVRTGFVWGLDDVSLQIVSRPHPP